MGLSGDAAVAMNALGLHRLAMLEADADLGETLFEIGDGQGRCFALYSFQRAVTDALRDRRRRASVKGDAAADQEIAHLEALKNRIHAFLSAIDVTFVCYASEVRDDGRIVGLGEDIVQEQPETLHAVGTDAGLLLLDPRRHRSDLEPQRRDVP